MYNISLPVSGFGRPEKTGFGSGSGNPYLLLFRESLAQVEARIAEENAKKKEIERKRAEGEVGVWPRGE